VRLTIRIEAERGFLNRWTIGKISRRIGHGRCPFL
jgi:hypothetical protein